MATQCDVDVPALVLITRCPRSPDGSGVPIGGGASGAGR
jgi:hypothetical protein